jgi:hypothetical protein
MQQHAIRLLALERAEILSRMLAHAERAQAGAADAEASATTARATVTVTGWSFSSSQNVTWMACRSTSRLDESRSKTSMGAWDVWVMVFA